VSPAWIRIRANADGSKSFQVLFRRGGRAYRIEHAGAFRGWPGGKDRTTGQPKPTVTTAERDARTRRDLIAGWLAQGLDPDVELARLSSPAAAPRSLSRWFDDFVESRIDVGVKAIASYRATQARLGDLGDLLPQDVRPAHVQTWIAENAALAPRSLGHYLSGIRQVLDFADVGPNPARSAKVRLPKGETAEPVPPTLEEWQKLKAEISNTTVLLLLRLLEATGLRVGEALALTWGDVDIAGGQFRISKARTKGRTAGQRWLPVPPDLLDEIAALTPFPDRARDRRVLHLEESAPRKALWAAGETLDLDFSPHDLRHRRISLWFAHGIDPITVAGWAGHARASMSSDTYGHVLMSLEDEWRDFWLGIYADARVKAAKAAGRDASVLPQEDEAR
jgi:integrase